MVDRRPFDSDVFDDSLAPSLATGNRKRHRSAGDHNRQLSSRRSRHSSGDPRVTFQRRRPDESNTEPGGDDSREFGEDNKLMCDIADNHAELVRTRKLPAVVSPVAAPPPVVCDFALLDEPKTPTLPAIAEKPPQSVSRTPVTENDPLGLFFTEPEPLVVEPPKPVVNKCFDLMDLNLDSDDGETNDLLIDFQDRPTTLDLMERKRLHTISECSAGSLGSGSRQYTLSESSDSSADRQENHQNHAVSSPQPIRSPNRSVSSPQRASPQRSANSPLRTASPPRSATKPRSNTLPVTSPGGSSKSMTRSDSFSEVSWWIGSLFICLVHTV